MGDPSSAVLDLGSVKERCWSGRITPSNRAWAWRLLLGVIPDGGDAVEVEAALSSAAEKYFRLRAEHLPDISSASADDSGDPLSGVASGWSRFYASADLRAEIQKDLDRLVLSGLAEDHFSKSVYMPCMLTVLTVWATANEEIGYRQGMHEILALVVVVLEDESAFGCRRQRDDDEASREADCYALFDAIMAGHADSFKSGKDAPVIEACRQAQSAALGRFDPELAAILQRHEVEAQLYGLRWFRLLFLREFEAPANLAVCDAIFAAVSYDRSCGHPDHISFETVVQSFFVALLIAFGPTLRRAQDQMDCLGLLMRPQPDQTNVDEVLRYAKRVVFRQPEERGTIEPAAAAAPQPLAGPEEVKKEEQENADANLTTDPLAPTTHLMTAATTRKEDTLAPPRYFDDPLLGDDDLADTLDLALGTLSKYANTPEAVGALDKIRLVADRLRSAAPV